MILSTSEDLIRQYIESDGQQALTIILVIHGEVIFKRSCFLKLSNRFVPFLKNRKLVNDCLKVHVSGAVLHILPELIKDFLVTLREKSSLFDVLSGSFINTCKASYLQTHNKAFCHPIDPRHRLDHAESEHNWTIAEPFFLSHEVDQSDLHQYVLKPEYDKDHKFSIFDPEVYRYLDNWVEDDNGKINLENFKSWQKTFDATLSRDSFEFSHMIKDNTEIKAYVCRTSEGRLLKTTEERLLKITESL
ncbi:MAG: hypothetical protein HKP55_12130 [Gammaproteobacteria bacterium]|nr:hypothetical protein [Gammaproteobacteria bacterium]